MNLKYLVNHQTIKPPCPCSKKFLPLNETMLAFRFVFKQATTSDFLPSYVKNQNPGKSCEGYALSFFNTRKSAEAKFASLRARVDALSIYGNHIAELDLGDGDGLVCKPNVQGHFDLHEYVGAMFHNRIKAYHPL
ncbi:MAG: hypothetical protein K2Q26_09045 [Bdellovibrionales bacterium]|nr:hypothetical protein [Bdellovibrionales bacterium]